MTGVLIFELAVIAITIGLWYYMEKSGYKRVWQKILILFVGVLLFEMMSEPMWRNFELHSWTYLYRNVSWIITLGWTNIFLVSMIVVDKFFKQRKESSKFWLYLLFVTIITTPIEVILLKIGIRGYDPVLTTTMSGINIPFTNAPIEILIAIPIIAALVIPFYKVMVRLFHVERSV